MGRWDVSLTRLCDKYFSSDNNMMWILVGSVGSVLQGADMNPGDIDVYVRDQQDVLRFAEILDEFSLHTRSPLEYGDHWLSSKAEPIFTQTFPSGFTWTKGRWNVENFKVEVVHISNSAGIPNSMDGDGIWEGGHYIWGLSKPVKFKQYVVQTVPLEIQLESNLRRKRQERVDAIIEALKTHGYDKELISKALSTRNLAYFQEVVGE